MNPLSSPQNAKTLVKQLSNHSWFQQLLHATDMRNRMQSIFNQTLPEDLINKYHVLEIQDTELLIGTDNAGHATRLRYVAAQIVESLKQHDIFASVKTLSCMVMPPKSAYVPEQRKVEPMPESAAKSMKAIANGIDDPDLKAAMLKLARNVEEE